MTKDVIPLSGGSVSSDLTFRVQLGQNLLEIRQLYRTLLGDWMISGSIDGVSVFDGVMLLVGDDLISTYNISTTFGKLYFTGEPATIDNLGVANQLVWVSPDE